MKPRDKKKKKGKCRYMYKDISGGLHDTSSPSQGHELNRARGRLLPPGFHTIKYLPACSSNFNLSLHFLCLLFRLLYRNEWFSEVQTFVIFSILSQ